METLGQYLKRERELRHISLEELAKHTKYHISKIRALEVDNYDELPAMPYVRGMLRSISSFLGLDVTDILLRYQDSLNETQIQSPQKEIGLPKIPFYKRRHFLTVTATTSFFVLAVLVFILFRESKKLEPIGSITMPSQIEKEDEENLVVSRPKGYKLRMEATKNVWIKAQIDSARPQQIHLRAGQSTELSAKKVLRFFINDIGHVKLMFNGKEIKSDLTGPTTMVFPSRHGSRTKSRGK